MSNVSGRADRVVRIGLQTSCRRAARASVGTIRPSPSPRSDSGRWPRPRAARRGGQSPVATAAEPRVAHAGANLALSPIQSSEMPLGGPRRPPEGLSCAGWGITPPVASSRLQQEKSRSGGAKRPLLNLESRTFWTCLGVATLRARHSTRDRSRGHRPLAALHAGVLFRGGRGSQQVRIEDVLVIFSGDPSRRLEAGKRGLRINDFDAWSLVGDVLVGSVLMATRRPSARLSPDRKSVV